jgi:hypothetical protein
MYRASGALFSTIETVADENPLAVATSRIVTAALLRLLFRISPLSPPSSLILLYPAPSRRISLQIPDLTLLLRI